MDDGAAVPPDPAELGIIQWEPAFDEPLGEPPLQPSIMAANAINAVQRSSLAVARVMLSVCSWLCPVREPTKMASLPIGSNCGRVVCMAESESQKPKAQPGQGTDAASDAPLDEMALDGVTGGAVTAAHELTHTIQQSRSVGANQTITVDGARTDNVRNGKG